MLRPLAELSPSPPHRLSSASPSPRLSSHRLKGSIIDTGVSNAIIPPTIDYYCPPIIVSYCRLLGRRTAWMLGRTPLWAMVTPASSLFRWRWRGMIMVFFLSWEALPANSRNQTVSCPLYSLWPLSGICFRELATLKSKCRSISIVSFLQSLRSRLFRNLNLNWNWQKLECSTLNNWFGLWRCEESRIPFLF